MPARAFVDSDAIVRCTGATIPPGSSKCPRGHLLILIYIHPITLGRSSV